MKTRQIKPYGKTIKPLLQKTRMSQQGTEMLRLTTQLLEMIRLSVKSTLCASMKGTQQKNLSLWN